MILARALFLTSLLGGHWLSCSPAMAQTTIPSPPIPAATPDEASKAPPPPPKTVNVVPVAQDDEIAERLKRILDATEWFQNGEVKVDEGVVFLSGQTRETRYKEWATNLAQNTEDVVAVVNRITVTEGSPWDLTPAFHELESMGRQTIQALPLMGMAVIVLVLTWISAGWTIILARRAFARRVQNAMLQQVGARALAFPVAIIGIYLALRICGLTQVAATVVGGTGLIGLVVGIAFRDIAENFLASVLLGIQRPFQLADLVEVNGIQGVVQSVTTRGTLLMTLDGNHVQIPNALIYKSVVQNLTANPNVRLNFSLPIPESVRADEAQKAILNVVVAHPAVLKDPEPLVLVEELTATGAMLRIYFWIDAHRYSSLKVRSAILRLTEQVLEEMKTGDAAATNGNAKLPAPDVSARKHPSSKSACSVESKMAAGEMEVENIAEGGLQSERHEIERQAQNSAPRTDGTNLLTLNPSSTSS